jgi:hypothetical protein
VPGTQFEIMQRLYGFNLWDTYNLQRVPDFQGWNGDHPSLTKIASLPGSVIVIDVGVWKGQSSINMASAMRDLGIDGVVIAVDTFLGSPEHWTRTDLFSRISGRPDLYETFLANVVSANLTDYVIPLAQTSTTAAKILDHSGIRANVIHIDAAHEYREVINDLYDYWPLVADDGYLIGDDYDQTWPGIIQAAGEFSAALKLPLSVEPPKFILRKSP